MELLLCDAGWNQIFLSSLSTSYTGTTSFSFNIGIQLKQLSGISLLIANPFNNERAPIEMHAICCEAVRGTSIKARPPKVIMNSWQTNMPTTINMNKGLFNMWLNTFMSYLSSLRALKKLNTCKNTKILKNIDKCWPVYAFQCYFYKPIELFTSNIYGPLNKIITRTIIWNKALIRINLHIWEVIIF